MKNISLIAAVALTGCVSMHESPSQNYRLAGDDEAITITGTVKRTDSIITQAHLTVFFNGVETISGEMGPGYTGEFTGQPWKGKPTSTTCTSTRKSNGGYDVRCMVFVANERTVTLTF